RSLARSLRQLREELGALLAREELGPGPDDRRGGIHHRELLLRPVEPEPPVEGRRASRDRRKQRLDRSRRGDVRSLERARPFVPYLASLLIALEMPHRGGKALPHIGASREDLAQGPDRLG